MNKTFERIGKSIQGVVSRLLVVAIVVGTMQVGLVMAKAAYTITGNYVQNGQVVDVSGTVDANPYVGQFAAHHVYVDWGDGTTDMTSTENFTDPDGPNSGTKTFTGTWSNSHTYTTGGTFTITVILYHSQP